MIPVVFISSFEVSVIGRNSTLKKNILVLDTVLRGLRSLLYELTGKYFYLTEFLTVGISNSVPHI